MRHLLIISILALSITVLPVWTSAKEFFPHEAHIKYYIDNVTCDICHLTEAKSIVPDKKVCLQCHEDGFPDEISFVSPRTHGPTWALQHRSEAKAGVINCAGCHAQDFCLECHKIGPADEMGSLGNNLINVHRSDFFVTHPIAARTDPQLCSSCHENKFCFECHSDFRRDELAGVSHRRSWSGRLVGIVPHKQFRTDQCQVCHPGSVLPSHEWASGHAREARKNLATCQACHPEGEICLTCHSARSGLMINPHPSNWGEIKGRFKDASNGKTCRKCH